MFSIVIATGVAILRFTSAMLQVVGGAIIGLVLGETAGGVALDTSLAAAYGAIGALFGLLSWLVKGRIDRCDSREDKLVEADAAKTEAIRKLGEAVTASATVTTQAVTAATGAIDESKRGGEKINAVITALANIQTAVDKNSQKLDYLLPDDTPPTRRR